MPESSNDENTTTTPSPVDIDTPNIPAKYKGSTVHYFTGKADITTPSRISDQHYADTRSFLSPYDNSPLAAKRYTGLDLTSIAPDPIASYTKYGVMPSTHIGDVGEMRALRQSNASKAANGLKRAGVTFTASVLENLGSIPGAMYEAIDGGSKTKGGEVLYDNPVTRLGDSMRDWSRENYEVHLTSQQQNESLREKLGSGVYWANEIADGFAYSLASMATALIPSSLKFMPLTRGMKIAGSLMNKATKARSLEAQYRLFKSLQYNKNWTSRTNVKGQKLLGADGMPPKVSLVDKALKDAKINKIAKYTKAVEQIESATMMSMAESGIEAREARDVYIDTLLAEEAERLGINISELPVEITEEIRRAGRAVGNSVFALNLAVLSVSNSVIFGRAIKFGAGVPKSSLYNKVTSKMGFKDASGNVIKGTLKNKLRGYANGIGPGYGKRTMYNAYDEMSFLRKALKVSGEAGKASLKAGPLELFQENFQVAAKHGSIDYHTDKYFDAGTEDLVESFGNAFEYSFGSDEGKEAMLIGFIVGSIMGGAQVLGSKIRSPKTAAKEKAAIQEVMNMYNSGLMDNPVNAINKAEYQGTILQEIQDIQEALFDLDDFKDTDVDPDGDIYRGLGNKMAELGEGDLEGLDPDDPARQRKSNLIKTGKGYRVVKGRKIVPGKGTSAPGTTAGQKGKLDTAPEDTTKPEDTTEDTTEETLDRDTVPADEWERFLKNVKSGENDITYKRAANIAQKVKEGVPLTPREQAMYEAKKEYITNIIQSKAQKERAKEYYRANPNRALRRLEELTFKLLQEEAIYHLEKGTFDLFLMKLDDTRGLSDEEFKKAFGISKEMMEQSMNKATEVVDAKGNPQQESQWFKEIYVDRIIERSRKLQAQHEKINLLFPEFERGSNLTTEEKVDEQIRYERWLRGKLGLYRHATYLDYLDDIIDRAMEDLATLSKDIDLDKLKRSIVADFEIIIQQVEKDKIFEPGRRPKYKRNEKGEIVGETGEEIKGYLRDVYEDILQDKPLEKELFRQIFTEMAKLMMDKEQIIEVFESLVTSDTALEDYIEAKEGREYVGKTMRRKERTIRIIYDAKTPADLETILKSEEVPEDLKPIISDKLAKMRKEKNNFRSKFLKMSLADLEALNTEDFSELEQEAYDEILKQKEKYKENGEPDPHVKAKDTRGKNASEKEPETGEKKKEDKKKEEEKKEGATTKEEEEKGEEEEEANSKVKDERLPLKAVVRQNVVMLKDGDGTYRRVLMVNDDEEEQLSYQYYDINNDLIVINDKLLQTPDILEKTVEFVRIPVQEANWAPSDFKHSWMDEPIFVKLGDDIVGVLQSYSDTYKELTMGRESIWGHLNDGKRAFATIKESGLTNNSNINNTRTKTVAGLEKVFFDPAKTFTNRLDVQAVRNAEMEQDLKYFQNENAGVVVAIPVGWGDKIGMKVLDNTLAEDSWKRTRIEADLDAEMTSNAANRKKYKVGQPVFAVINPATGKYQSIIGSTQYLTDDAIDAIRKAISVRDLIKVQDIVGLTYTSIHSGSDPNFLNIAKFSGVPDSPNFYLNDPNLKQTIENWFMENQDTMEIYFHSDTAAKETKAKNTLIKINSANLTKALDEKNTAPIEYTLVEMHAKEGKDGNPIIQAREIKTPMGEGTLKLIKANIGKDFITLLKRKKFQVSAERLASNVQFTSPVTGTIYNTYQDYLFSADEMAGQKDEGNKVKRAPKTKRGGVGHLSILTTDVKNLNGTVFSNPRISFVDLRITKDPQKSEPEAPETGPSSDESQQNAFEEKHKNRTGADTKTTEETEETGSITDFEELKKSTEQDNPDAKKIIRNTKFVLVEALKKDPNLTEVLSTLTDEHWESLKEAIEDPNVSIEDMEKLLENLPCFKL